jgi:hypothetical protein
MPYPDDENAFELLCRLASKEQWCWMIPCNTCGNHEFKYGLRELGRGHSPADPDWVVHKCNGTLGQILDEIPYATGLADPEIVAVVEVCAGANLKRIADDCLFPDWLGYLGIVLARAYCEDVAYEKLTALWAWQLRDFVGRDSTIWSHLDECARLSDRRLSFGDLEAVEQAILELRRT